MIKDGPRRRLSDLKVIAETLRMESLPEAALRLLRLLPAISVEDVFRRLGDEAPDDDVERRRLGHRDPGGGRKLELARLPGVLGVAQELVGAVPLHVDADRHAAFGIGDKAVNATGNRLNGVGLLHELETLGVAGIEHAVAHEGVLALADLVALLGEVLERLHRDIEIIVELLGALVPIGFVLGELVASLAIGELFQEIDALREIDQSGARRARLAGGRILALHHGGVAAIDEADDLAARVDER